jgi:hypothetical protein
LNAIGSGSVSSIRSWRRFERRFRRILVRRQTPNRARLRHPFKDRQYKERGLLLCHSLDRFRKAAAAAVVARWIH